MLNRLMVLLGLFLSLAATTCHAALLDWTESTFTNGQKYRLVFVTSTTRRASSVDIADYNAHVTSAAALSGDLSGVTGSWSAIASTQLVDAIDNTQTPTTTSGIPVYLVDSTKVADDYASLWDGGIDAAINIEESGSVTFSVTSLVWTGSSTFGVVSTGLGEQDPMYGRRTNADSDWTSVGTTSAQFAGHLYAMSDVQTHASTATVPEPTSLMLLSTVAGIGFVTRRVRRRATASGSGVTHS